jgi:hypothetical protein
MWLIPPQSSGETETSSHHSALDHLTNLVSIPLQHSNPLVSVEYIAPPTSEGLDHPQECPFNTNPYIKLIYPPLYLNNAKAQISLEFPETLINYPSNSNEFHETPINYPRISLSNSNQQKCCPRPVKQIYSTNMSQFLQCAGKSAKRMGEEGVQRPIHSQSGEEVTRSHNSG